jgi:two-component system, LytTR family, sensor histidine kinase AlgZ
MDNRNCTVTPAAQLDESPWRSVRNVLLINAAIGLGITGLNLTVGSWLGWEWFRELVLANLIYANVIGCLAALVIPPVAIFTSMWRPVRRWAAYLSALLAVGLAGPLAASAALVLFGFAGPHRIWHIYQRSVGLALLLVIVIGLVAYWLERLRYQAEATTRALRAKQLEHERAEKLAAEARLLSLESRLQPHFLFNTINSILALIREDPARAEAMLERLSRLLRFALDSQQRSLVPLAEELRLVEDYLEIERTRFGGRLQFELHGSGDAGEQQIPAFAIQTLVENSVKFAIATRRAGGVIMVSVRREPASLIIEVADDGPGFAREDMREGHGLDTLEKRLAGLYDGRARLLIGNGAGARVQLHIPAGDPRS